VVNTYTVAVSSVSVGNLVDLQRSW